MATTSNAPVIDADGHVMEPLTLWAERMDRKKWGDLIPRFDPDEGSFVIGGVPRVGGRKVFAELAAERGITLEEFVKVTTSPYRHDPGGYDPRGRIAALDRDGIDAAVLYASTALFFGPADPNEALRNPEFVAACQRAYNEWIGDFCREAPDRLFGMAAVPLQDPKLACREARHAVEKLGLKGVFVRPSAYVDELPLSHGVYDEFWATCQDLGAPVAFHPGVHADTPGACRKFQLVKESPDLAITNRAVSEIYGGSGLGQAIGNAVDMIVTMGRLLMGGVCERFPRLKFLFLEAGGGWCATILERMDEQVEAFWLERRWLSMLPSEY
ncbi:MAG: amidohydrolase family protein, partial [Candidatus Binatia bacterium]